MKQIKIAALTMIVVAFMIKTYRKLTQNPEDRKRELNEILAQEKIEAYRRRAYEEKKRQLDASSLAGCATMENSANRYCGDSAIRYCGET